MDSDPGGARVPRAPLDPPLTIELKLGKFTSSAVYRVGRYFKLITTRKRSLGQGNIFTGVCLSTGGRDGVSLTESPLDRNPHTKIACTVKSGWYASY